MTLYRHRTSEKIQTIEEIKQANAHTSFPATITADVLSGFGYDELHPVTPSALSSTFKIRVRDGEEQKDGKWYEKWKEEDMFADIEGGKTKAEQEADMQKELDNHQKNTLRNIREPLLVEADWKINTLEDAGSSTTDWRAYRQQLRDITKASDIYDVTWPTKPS